MNTDMFFTLALFLVVFAAAWEAKDWGITTRLFPWVISFPVLGLLLLQLVYQLFKSEHRAGTQPGPEVHSGFESGTERKRGAEILLWIFLFASAVWVLGFMFGGPLITLAYLRLSARERWRASLALTAGVLTMLWIMVKFLNVPLPSGILFRAIGT